MSTERTKRPAGDQARVSVAVAVPPDVAFQIFTNEIDRWWKRGPRFRGRRGDHPARHGMAAAAFVRSLGMWWAEQLTSLRLTTGLTS